MSLRREFVALAAQRDADMAELCSRFKISRKTGYKWLGRFEFAGPDGLADRSRRPHSSPSRTAASIEQAILELRQAHPAWGARKLLRRLRDLGWKNLPSPSTAQAILTRNGCIATAESNKHKPFTRFEREQPNSLWQMDYKGHFGLANGGRCHPLTVLDDHARFNLGLRACDNERGVTVQAELTVIFERYGLPDSIGTDNGPPWGDSYDQPYTPLTVWLIRNGITVWHSRPSHPQTLGKDERFHRTLKDELLVRRCFADLAAVQIGFDHWRDVYNCERPHDALAGDTPASRYRVSSRRFSPVPRPIEYEGDCQVRKVDKLGKLTLHGRRIHVSKAFRGYPVALRASGTDGVWDVYFCNQKIKTIDLRLPESVA